MPCAAMRPSSASPRQRACPRESGGPQQVAELLRRVASEESVPALAREMLGMLAGQLEVLNAKLKAIEVRLMAWHREDQTSQCLATIPGIGPIGGVSFALKSLPPRRRGCRTRRPFARAGTLRRGSASRRARIPLRANPGKISREGDESLRRLLVLGATA